LNGIFGYKKGEATGEGVKLLQPILYCLEQINKGRINGSDIRYSEEVGRFGRLRVYGRKILSLKESFGKKKA
jgi:hypothetical protein